MSVSYTTSVAVSIDYCRLKYQISRSLMVLPQNSLAVTRRAVELWSVSWTPSPQLVSMSTERTHGRTLSFFPSRLVSGKLYWLFKDNLSEKKSK